MVSFLLKNKIWKNFVKILQVHSVQIWSFLWSSIFFFVDFGWLSSISLDRADSIVLETPLSRPSKTFDFPVALDKLPVLHDVKKFELFFLHVKIIFDVLQ